MLGEPEAQSAAQLISTGFSSTARSRLTEMREIWDATAFLPDCYDHKLLARGVSRDSLVAGSSWEIGNHSRSEDTRHSTFLIGVQSSSLLVSETPAKPAPHRRGGRAFTTAASPLGAVQSTPARATGGRRRTGL